MKYNLPLSGPAKLADKPVGNEVHVEAAIPQQHHTVVVLWCPGSCRDRNGHSGTVVCFNRVLDQCVSLRREFWSSVDLWWIFVMTEECNRNLGIDFQRLVEMNEKKDERSVYVG